MKTFLLTGLAITLAITIWAQHKKQNNMNLNKLTPEEEYVMLKKGTEAPFSGEYNNFYKKGIYLCKQCDAPLYRSSDKFDSGCGWPAFDDEIPNAVIRKPDNDGKRTEIICANCKGHLGHVFLNEHLTPKETRHCVNSISLKFKPDKPEQISKAYFASGCFWGTEYYFQKLKGVKETTVGFMGGSTKHPTYKEVCSQKTGHFETVEIEYDPEIVSYESLVKFFFETHDFTQTDGQGPDIGTQYLSVIFYADQKQKEIAEEYIHKLTIMGYKVATRLLPVSTFWPAENCHQDYYENKGTTPYCHKYHKIF